MPVSRLALASGLGAFEGDEQALHASGPHSPLDVDRCDGLELPAALRVLVQGLLQLGVRHLPADEALPKLDDMQIGRQVAFGGKAFEVEDIKPVTCLGGEGELPFRAVKGRQSTYVDLLGPDSKFASIEYGPEGVAVYLGEYVDFDALKLGNLKQIEGW